MHNSIKAGGFTGSAFLRIIPHDPMINFLIPKAPIKLYINLTTQWATILVFDKINIDMPWGDFDVLLELNEKISVQGGNQKIMPDSSSAPNVKPMIGPELPPQNLAATQNNSDQIECRACTLLNSATATVCDACGTPLQKAATNASYHVNI